MEKTQVNQIERFKDPSTNGISSIGSPKELESAHARRLTSTTTDMIPAPEVAQHPPMTLKRGMALISLTLLFVTSVAPTIFISSSLAYIVADIGGQNSIAWIVMANSLATASTAPFAGTISDLFGRRSVALFGAGVVIIGSIVTGCAWRVEVAIVGMALVGMGGGLSEVVAAAAVAEMAPVKNRGKYMGTAFLFVLPFGASSVYAQLYSMRATWRWGAWISVIIVGINFVTVWIFYTPPPRRNSQGLSRTQILRKVDYVGGLLSTCGFATFLLGIQWGGYTYPWISAPVLTTIILGGLVLILFVIWERRTDHPMFPRSLFTDKKFSTLILFISGISGLNYHALSVLWPLQCQVLFGPDPLKISRIISATGFSIIIGIIVINWLLSRLRGAARELMTLCCAIMTAGTGSMALINQNTPNLAIGLSILTAFGIGGLLQPTGTILTIVTPDELLATIIAASITVRVVGGTIGYAIYFNILQNELTEVLRENVINASLHAGLPPGELGLFAEALLSKNSTALNSFPEAVVDAAMDAVKDSYDAGFRTIYLVSIAFGAVAIVASVMLGDIPKHMVDRVAVDIH